MYTQAMGTVRLEYQRVLSELSYLIELLLNHDLPKATKDSVASRIRDVEGKLTQPQFRVPNIHPGPHIAPTQAASTLALMAKHGDLPVLTPTPIMPPIEPVTQVAQTPATAAAMNARNEAITRATSAKPLAGKPGEGRTSPRKW